MDDFDLKHNEENPSAKAQPEEIPTSPAAEPQQSVPQTVSPGQQAEQTAWQSGEIPPAKPPEQAPQAFYPPYAPAQPQGTPSPYSGVYPGYPQQPAPGYGYQNYPYHTPQPYYQQPPQGWVPAPTGQGKKWSASKIVCVAIAVVLELVIIGFSVFGIYALCTGNYGYRQTPSFNQGYYQQPGTNQGGGNGGTEEESNTSARMGLTCSMLTDDQAASINVSSGMLIVGIDSDSDARNHDISMGDVITHIDGVAMTSFDDYYALMENKQPGDTVELTVVKVKDTQNDQGVWDTETVQATITLLEKESEDSKYPET